VISIALPYLALALGLLCAAGGGDLFVRGAVGIARAARVAPGVIAATVAAFATSSPELTVAVQSALAGEPEISLGDALGSNVANIALIFGVALLFGPLAVIRNQVTRDFAVAAATPVALSVMLVDGSLSSNIFNGLFIIGVAGAITPIRTSELEAAPALIASLISLALVYPPRNGVYRPWRGVALLAVYGAYLAAVIASGS